MRARLYWLPLLAALLLSFAACTVPAPAAPAPAAPEDEGTELTTVRIGTQPWIGYGPWWIAQDQGMFEEHGLQAELIDFVQDSEVNAAFAANEMDAANLATHTAIKLFENGVDLRIVLLEDASYQADAIIAGADIESIADLAGKSVAYEEGATSDLLLNYALAQNGMSLADINPVPMPAADAGATLIAGQVDAAVTYEPYIAAALADDDSVSVIYDASARPGLISDVLAVRTEFAENNPDVVEALLRVWDEAVAFYRQNPEEGKAIIAEAVGSSAEELATAFEGVRFYDLEENRQQLTGEFMTTMQDVSDVAASIGITSGSADLETLVDASYLEE